MALRAVECAVTAGEWETGWMDKRGAFPRRCRVALCAVLREAGRFVIRICDLLIVVQMAVHAVRLQRADTSFMTHRTRDCRVTARKRKLAGCWNVAPSQVVAVWHCVQSVGNPDAAWFGSAVDW